MIQKPGEKTINLVNVFTADGVNTTGFKYSVQIAGRLESITYLGRVFPSRLTILFLSPYHRSFIPYA